MVEQIGNSRFKDAVWYSQQKRKVVVGGAGGIGSWLTLFLARANFKVMLYDFDYFEEHNLSGQLFLENQVGRSKVAAVSETVTQLCCSDSVIPVNSRIGSNFAIFGDTRYVFSAFDNMEARKILFEKWVTMVENNNLMEDPNIPVFIDGRLEMEQLQIFCVTPDKIAMYRETLFNSSDIPDEACTLKQTSHVAALISSLMTGFFTNHISNIVLEREIREVPFFYEYFLPQNLVTDVY